MHLWSDNSRRMSLPGVNNAWGKSKLDTAVIQVSVKPTDGKRKSNKRKNREPDLRKIFFLLTDRCCLFFFQKQFRIHHTSAAISCFPPSFWTFPSIPTPCAEKCVWAREICVVLMYVTVGVLPVGRCEPRVLNGLWLLRSVLDPNDPQCTPASSNGY